MGNGSGGHLAISVVIDWLETAEAEPHAEGEEPPPRPKFVVVSNATVDFEPMQPTMPYFRSADFQVPAATPLYANFRSAEAAVCGSCIHLPSTGR